MEEFRISSSLNLVNDGGLKIEEDRARNVLASGSLREEGLRGLVVVLDSFLQGTVGVDTFS